MRMHVLSGGRLRMKRKVYVPDAASGEMIDLPVMCCLLRHPQGNVLFDTGCHPAVEYDPESRWGGMAKVMSLISAPGDNLPNNLKAIGVELDDIDVVVNSHFHTDHCGCNEFFRRATVVCHADELAAASAADAEKVGFVAADWKHPNRFEAITQQRDLFGDGRIVLLPLPGHTQGTTTALVGLDRSGSHLLASDVVALRLHLEQDLVPRNTWNAERALHSVAEVRRIEAGGAAVLFGHDAEQWDSLKKGADFYD